MKKVIMSWSGGKDSVLCLDVLKQSSEYELIAFITNISESTKRVKMHDVPQELILKQAESLGLPVDFIELPEKTKNGDYERALGNLIGRWRKAGAEAMAFGDLFLEDIRRYRDGLMEKFDFKAVYPLWQKSTDDLAGQFLKEGYRAIICCVDGQAASPNLAGRIYDESFLKDLCPEADPCGEKGEFHTFVFDGPSFRFPVPFEKGENYVKDNRFYYCDLQAPQVAEKLP